MLVTHPSPSGSYTLLSPGATHLPLDSHPHILALQILFPRTQGQVVLLGTATGVPQRGTESERRKRGEYSHLLSRCRQVPPAADTWLQLPASPPLCSGFATLLWYWQIRPRFAVSTLEVMPFLRRSRSFPHKGLSTDQPARAPSLSSWFDNHVLLPFVFPGYLTSPATTF